MVFETGNRGQPKELKWISCIFDEPPYTASWYLFQDWTEFWHFVLRLPLQIENSYRIKKEVLEKSKTAATAKQKHVGPRQFPNNAYLGDTAEEAAITAAYKVAEAENKSFVAAEAAKEAERVSKMEEDSDNSLQIYKDLFDKCMFLPYSSCLYVLYFKLAREIVVYIFIFLHQQVHMAKLCC